MALEQTVAEIHTLAENAKTIINRITPELNMLDDISCRLSELHKQAVSEGRLPFPHEVGKGEIGVDTEGVEYRVTARYHEEPRIGNSRYNNPLANLTDPDAFRRKACGAAPRPPLVSDYHRQPFVSGVMLTTTGRPTGKTPSVIHAVLKPKYPAPEEK